MGVVASLEHRFSALEEAVGRLALGELSELGVEVTAIGLIRHTAMLPRLGCRRSTGRLARRLRRLTEEVRDLRIALEINDANSAAPAVGICAGSLHRISIPSCAERRATSEYHQLPTIDAAAEALKGIGTEWEVVLREKACPRALDSRLEAIGYSGIRGASDGTEQRKN